MFSSIVFIVISIIEINCDNECSKTICNPTAGDLLIGRESLLKASSTCGLMVNERYCIVTLTDRSGDPKCSICYSRDPYNPFSSPNSHRIENVVSRLPQDSGRWWQSTNGAHNTSIEVAFETEFQFIFTQLRFKTYRPAAMYIERSKDYGLTWQKSAFFSDNCARDFPTIPARKRNYIGEVSCTSEFSSISPSESGTALFVATPSDLHTGDKDWIEKRNEITAITNLRVQFVRLHTFGDWKIDNNPNILNKYYYAVSEWIIRGRCSCYGHASRCKPKEGQVQRKEMVYGVCVCQHNTMGQHCQKCKDFYNDKPWLPAEVNSTNECKKCNCNSHSSSCHFDPVVYDLSGRIGGGICDNCLHNTEGKNCDRCRSGYYRNTAVALNSADTCLKCKCDPHGTIYPNLCIQESEPDQNIVAGSCVCKENIDGFYCDRCKTGFWNFDKNNEKGCTKCKCLMIGTINGEGCDSVSGRCFCKTFVDGRLCNTCKDGYYNMSASNPSGCGPCGCREQGSLEYRKCDKFSGQCRCRQGYVGRTCNEIKDSWFIDSPRHGLKFRENTQIELPPVSKSGYYNFIITTDTQQMHISDTFLVILTADHNVKSNCQAYQDSISITKDTKNIVIPNKCLEENLPIIISVFPFQGPTDNSKTPTIVDVVVIPMLFPSSPETRTALAECLKHSSDSLPAKCNFLKVELSSRAISNSGPQTCQCNVTGSVGNNCNKFGGQCTCLPNVSGRQCDKCSSNSYGFDARGCKSCDCDPQGSLNLQCAPDTGKCMCRPGVEGQHCSHCKVGFWRFPFCEPCKCHGMSDVCDSKTGECLNCRGHSFGFNCQQCDVGYYGDPSKNLRCLKCNCPGLSLNLNHSIKCSLIFNTLSYICVCKPGYRGKFCDECDLNYYGNPREKDGGCNLCHCSQNIDLSVAGSCDKRTGECKKCLYNTAGFNCEKCASGYFGIGVTRTCKRCVCNKIGTDPKADSECHHESGRCPCRPNVIGQQCDTCAPGYFNISSGKGCEPCDCDSSNGALNNTCNKLTGQCHCREGKSGRQCDKCKDGYWGDHRKPDGCQICQCHSEGSLFKQCDRNNGACRCRPGITGRHCDMCAQGTDGKMPHCSSCGDCWIQWDQIVQQLTASIKSLENGTFQNITSVKLPDKLETILKSITSFMSSINLIMKQIPTDLDSQLQGIQFRLNGLRKEYEKIVLPYFNVDEFDGSAIINSIMNMTELVTSNRMKDVEGAYKVILKSLLSIKDDLLSLESLNLRIQKMIGRTLEAENEMKNIDLEKLKSKSRKLTNLQKGISQKLIVFNKLTCNEGPTTDLCSDPCGGIGCLTNNCSRIPIVDTQCFVFPSSNFFNAHAWNLDSRKSPNDLLRIIERELPKDVKEKLANVKLEVEATKGLSGATNQTVNTRYTKAIDLLKTLSNAINNTVSEEDFKRILMEIRDFNLSSRETEIRSIEKEIEIRIQQLLMKVNDILAKSNETRTECDKLKMNAIGAKQQATDLLNSITDLEYNLRRVLTTQNETRMVHANGRIDSVQLSKELELIAQNEKDTDNIQNQLTRDKIVVNLLNANINGSMAEAGKTITLLQKDQITIRELLKGQKFRTNNILKQKQDLAKTFNKTKNEMEGKRRGLLDSINELNKRITNTRFRITQARNSLKDKQTELNDLSQKIEAKVKRFSDLEYEIYAKSEFQAACLP